MSDEQVNEQVETDGNQEEKPAEQQTEPKEEEGAQEAQAEGLGTDQDKEELTVTLGDEESEEEKDNRRAPNWVRELRRNYREQQKENRELKQQIEQLSSAGKPAEVGQKPTLEGCDYDNDVYEKRLTDWFERKRQSEVQEEDKRRTQQKEQEAWQGVLNGYDEEKQKLAVKVDDFEDSEAAVQSSFDITQQGIVLQGCKNSALMFYALGKNPQKLNHLSKIKDPIKFAFAVSEMESQLKVTKRKPEVKPETKVEGSASKSSTIEQTLERLRAEAAKTGNYTKVYQYKQQLRENRS